MAGWQKWILGVFGVLAVLLGLAWIFRVDLALWGVENLIRSRFEIGPTQEIQWSNGTDPQDRPAQDRPPNIVLILADDLGWNDVSMNGGASATVATPNIDALAASGVTFSQGYAANATCAPSRAALMSGRYGTRFGFEFNPTPNVMSRVIGLIGSAGERPFAPPAINNTETSRLPSDEKGMPPSEITLAELLGHQGYHTVHIGKWHLGNAPGMTAHDQGFDESLLSPSALYGRRDDADVIQSRQPFDPLDRFLWAIFPFAARFNGGPAFEPPYYLTDYYTDEAIKVIKANKDRPFFLYLAHWAPHNPLQASREDYEALDHIESHRERVYAAMIRALDRGVGEVMAALKAQGLDDNTLVMFTSDNGGAHYIGVPNVNAPYRGWKLSLFEGGLRVPFAMRWPNRIPAGLTVDAPVHHFDMYATAAAAAGAALPEDRVMDGVDLVAHVEEGDTARPHDYLFFRSGAAQAVRDERYKLVVSAPMGGERKEWLFDLSSENPEDTDLLSQEPEIATRLRNALDAHNAEQKRSLWPWLRTYPINIDRDLSQPDQEDDTFAYWSN